MEQIRKPAQEVEIDHLLAEEFLCDELFGERFMAGCHLPWEGFRTVAATPEPSLGGNGFGDVLVEAELQGSRVALLIEDKITAGPALRQASRYRDFSERLRALGHSSVWTILVAPQAHMGERDGYDASIDLEDIAAILSSPDLRRIDYRRGIINRALEKRSATGVQVPDEALHRMKSEYLAFLGQWSAVEASTMSFPPLRKSYYDGDSWIEPIRDDRLPPHVSLRHRLWTSIQARSGMIDLIASPADQSEQLRLFNAAPVGASVAPFSKEKGVQISLPLPEMRQAGGFNPIVALEACRLMETLIQWYVRLGI